MCVREQAFVLVPISRAAASLWLQHTHTHTHSSCREDSGKGTQSLIRLGWLSHRQRVIILIASFSLYPCLLTHTHATSASSSSQYHPHAIHYILASGWSMMQWRRFQFLKNPPNKMLLKWASRFYSHVTISTEVNNIQHNDRPVNQCSTVGIMRHRTDANRRINTRKWHSLWRVEEKDVYRKNENASILHILEPHDKADWLMKAHPELWNQTQQTGKKM